MKRVIIYGKFWSPSDTRNNPDHLFIFGDNDIERGTGGQAIIRNEPNAFGIPTKKLPSMSADSFYTDIEYDKNKKKINLAIYKILKEFMKTKYTTLVIPKDGVGTGLSKLPEKAPRTFKYIEMKLNALKLLFM